MALKSSQPRRSASLKSERPILRTTNAVETPNTCSLGLANTVAMTPVSLFVGAPVTLRPLFARSRLRRENRESNPANQVPQKGALPDETCHDRCSELSAMQATQRSRLGDGASAHIVCCVASPNDWCRRMLAGFPRHWALHAPG